MVWRGRRQALPASPVGRCPARRLQLGYPGDKAVDLVGCRVTRTSSANETRNSEILGHMRSVEVSVRYEDAMVRREASGDIPGLHSIYRKREGGRPWNAGGRAIRRHAFQRI